MQIEVDEHFSNVGVITRIEAFLNSLNHRPVEVLPKDFVLEQVEIHPAISRRCRKGFSALVAAAGRIHGIVDRIFPCTR